MLTDELDEDAAAGDAAHATTPARWTLWAAPGVWRIGERRHRALPRARLVALGERRIRAGSGWLDHARMACDGRRP
jgi:hypothetical protein